MDLHGPPVFQRSPRLHLDLPKGEQEIPAPPSAPSAPSVTLGSLMTGLVPGVLGAGVIFLMGRGMGGSSMMMLAYSLPMLLMGGLVQVGMFFHQKKKYEADVRTREMRYRELLHSQAESLERTRELQQTGLVKKDAAPEDYLTRVEQRSPRLWERSPQDSDFLSIRLGLGTLPFVIDVKPPRENQALEPDPLYRQAQAVSSRFGHVAGVPILMPLREVGVAGVAGPRHAVLAAVRNMVMQIAGNHAPTEVKIIGIFPEEELEEWQWMRWLPHVWADDRRSRFLACAKDSAHDLLGALYDSLNRRKLQIAMQKDSAKGPVLPLMIFVLADPRLSTDEAITGLLLREGASLGALALVLSERKEDLPQECQAIAVVSSGSGQMMLTRPALTQVPFVPDVVPLDLADRVARAMAPIRLNQLVSSAEIPARVTLMELLGANQVEELDALSRWRKGEPFKSMAVPIGVRAGGEKLYLDLHERAHGPHGLGAGATGSGKSELLQTVIAALAVCFHPHDVAFVMVDYKGGGMANAFKGLPHLAGTITNLEGNLAKRALSALKAELKRRQRLLGEAGVNHIDDYMRVRRKGQPLTPVPHLIVVVDEFAELKAEQPDFMRELISAVRVGRSLGVHLILATQKPAGVVDEQIWSNTKFRLCLRVERPQDSQEVLKCPDAANITGAGRGYFQVGNNEIFELFQAGWGGAPYEPNRETQTVSHDVSIVALSGERRKLTGQPKPASAAGPATNTELQALVTYLNDVAVRAGIDPLEGPWTDPLPDHIVLELPRSEGWDGQAWRSASTWLSPRVGLLDDPENQNQPPLLMNLGRDGHLAVYGGPGMGKTTFLQTLLSSLALDHSPEELHMYLVDCSSRSLVMFNQMPHVGGVVLGEETERISRLLRFLLQELERRKLLLSEAGVSTFTAYRQVAVAKIPAIVVALDNYPALANLYPEGEEIAQLAREGGNLGIHLVVTANSPNALRTRVSSNISAVVSLSLTDRTDYMQAVGRTGGLEPMAVPGRGLIKAVPPLEFHTMLPTAGATEWERTTALKELFRSMDQAWTGARPAPVKVLKEIIPLAEILPPGDSWCGEDADAVLAVPIGVDVETLQPFAVNLQSEGPHLIITGPPESGKTSLLQTWLLALAERFSPDRVQFWIADLGAGHLEPLRGLPHVQAFATTLEELDVAVTDLADRIQERKQAIEVARRSGNAAVSQAGGAPGPAVIFAVDELDLIVEQMDILTKDRLEQAIRRERGVGMHVLAAGSSAGFQGYDSLMKALRDVQTGFVLGSSDHSDIGVFNVRMPAAESGQMLAPGLGYFVRRGRFRKVKAAMPASSELSLEQWVNRICRRCE